MDKKCGYCNAEIKVSKKGKEYCSNICWTKEPYKSEILEDRFQHECYMDTKHGDWGCRD